MGESKDSRLPSFLRAETLAQVLDEEGLARSAVAFDCQQVKFAGLS